ncbi:MAG: PHP domain-containing protein [bacterium]|nr:PHP domain-containing protein [bacterium]
MKADLHIHTYYSDSTFSPKEVVGKAKDKGLKTIAITDHDNIEGIAEAQRKGQEIGIEVIPGIELSAINRAYPNKDIHLLGYLVDYQDKNFLKSIRKFQQRRYSRAVEMVKKLNNCGIKISFEEVKEVSGYGSFGKLHVAKAIYKKGRFDGLGEIFEKYLNYGCPAYTEKYGLEIEEAIEILKKCKGIPVLAHPCYSKCEDVIESFVECGLIGIEVFHPEQNKEDQRRLIQIAKKYNLLITGGSDCHGLNKDGLLIGKIRVNGKIVDRMKKIKENL